MGRDKEKFLPTFSKKERKLFEREKEEQLHKEADQIINRLEWWIIDLCCKAPEVIYESTLAMINEFNPMVREYLQKRNEE